MLLYNLEDIADDALIRASAAEALGNIADPAALDALVYAIEDPDEAVRAFSAISIGLIGTREFTAKLSINLEKEHSEWVKAELLGACYRNGNRQVLDLLLKILETAELVVPILNLFSDLLDRKHPPTISADAWTIISVLNSVQSRIPLVSGHIEQINNRLKSPTDSLKV